MATIPSVTKKASGWRLEYVDGWGKRRRRNGFISESDALMFFKRLIEPHLGKVTEQPPQQRQRAPRPGYYVPVSRIRPLIEMWLDEGNIREQLDEADVRRVFAILSGDIQQVTVNVADRLLCVFGLSHYWHLPIEDGGLEDIYFHEDVVGAAA